MVLVSGLPDHQWYGNATQMQLDTCELNCKYRLWIRDHKEHEILAHLILGRTLHVPVEPHVLRLLPQARTHVSPPRLRLRLRPTIFLRLSRLSLR